MDTNERPRIPRMGVTRVYNNEIYTDEWVYKVLNVQKSLFAKVQLLFVSIRSYS